MSPMDDDPAVTRIAPLRCPYCGSDTDAVGTTDGSAGPPEEGCACACIACGGPMVFHRDPLTGLLTLYRMTRKEADALTDQEREDLARVQWFARCARAAGLQRARRN
jgi:hypothetical protein